MCANACYPLLCPTTLPYLCHPQDKAYICAKDRARRVPLGPDLQLRLLRQGLAGGEDARRRTMGRRLPSTLAAQGLLRPLVSTSRPERRTGHAIVCNAQGHDEQCRLAQPSPRARAAIGARRRRRAGGQLELGQQAPLTEAGDAPELLWRRLRLCDVGEWAEDDEEM